MKIGKLDDLNAFQLYDRDKEYISYNEIGLAWRLWAFRNQV